MKILGAACRHCHNGPIYIETCGEYGGPQGCLWPLASECQNCGYRFDNVEGCVEHGLPNKEV